MKGIYNTYCFVVEHQHLSQKNKNENDIFINEISYPQDKHCTK